jgi:PAS domain S-box-containing protein
VEAHVTGVQIETYPLAETAMARIAQVDYDAIISDVKMPGTDGFQLVEHVLNIRPTTPTLLLTGYPDHHVGVQALKAGAFAFIPKPIDRDFFLAWLKRAIQLRQLSRAVEQQNQILESIVQERTAALERTNRELKETLERERETERFNFSIVQSSPDCIMILDLTGKLLFMNRSGQRLLGISDVRRYLHQPWSELQIWNGTDREAVLAAERAGAAGETVSLVAISGTLAGEPTWWDVLITPILNEERQPEKLLMVTRDVTERKRAEASALQLAAIVESSEDAIISKTLTGIVQTWNAAAERLYGYEPHEIVGQPLSILIPPGRRDEEPAILDRITRGERIKQFETVRRRKDGSLVDVSLTISPIKDGTGQIIGASKIARDITERKRAEKSLRESEARYRHIAQQLREKQEQLIHAAKLTSLGEMATGVAHEINNPLNNIVLILGNVAERLQMGRLDFETLPRQLQSALRQVEKAAHIVDHLRTFGRKTTMPDSLVLVNDVITAAVSLTQAQFKQANMELTLDLSCSNPAVMGNAIHLEQVLINLLTNARDAVERTAKKTVHVSTRIEGSHVAVRVQDTGCGIAQHLQPKVFDPFFTTKDVGKGTGLGLSVSYGIIEDHSGTITVESEPGSGTTFTVRLPLAPDFSEA